MKKKVALHNLGCKVNSYELEAMRQMLEEHHYEIVPFAPGADVYIINTCTVTNIADRKSRQMLHKAKKMNPDSIVIAAGCYVEAAGEETLKDPSIDIIIGNNKKKELISILENYGENDPSTHTLPDLQHTKEYEELQITKTAEHTRAYIKVQDGCNQFCTYCIIPYTRGRVRSRNYMDVLAEVKRLADAGYQEVVLTGIHLSSYGVDLDQEVSDLLGLVQQVHEVEGISRIRLGSLEPGIITESFVQTLVKLPKVCPHFHLSLQSGSNATLQRMNRRYTAQEYEQRCKLLREYYQNPALTTDIIVGFPGETQAEFEETKAFVERIGFYETHIFKYSKREGTKAAVMPDQIPESLKAIRSKELIVMGTANKKCFMEQFLNQELEVLMEELSEIAGQSYCVGHTKEYLKVAVKTDEKLENQLVTVRSKEVLEAGFILGTR